MACTTPSSDPFASTWAHGMDNLYSFVYRGVLAEEALDRVGRSRRKHFGARKLGSCRRRCRTSCSRQKPSPTHSG